jgi:serine-type D-Ala-D-Ala carboxypeptidase/endopeptidase
MESLQARLARTGKRGHRAIVAGVVRGTETVRGGWAADGARPDGSTLFEIGSITKALTGILLADMHLRGEVYLDDPLTKHLPFPAPRWRFRPPTLLELATHLSGLPNTPGPLGRREMAFALGARRSDPWAGLSAGDYAALVSRESPRRPPGERVRYSSAGVGLLGEALAQRAGTTYERLLRDRILAPLGMTATSVAVPAEHAMRLFPGHSRRGAPRPPIQDFIAPAGSLRSSTDDMLRLLTACLRPTPDQIGRAIDLACAPQARIGRRVGIGLCWVISRPRRGPEVIWHNGGTWGFRGFGGFCRDQESAAIVMSNTARPVDRLGFLLAAGRV